MREEVKLQFPAKWHAVVQIEVDKATAQAPQEIPSVCSVVYRA
jgi:hypothetical protein